MLCFVFLDYDDDWEDWNRYENGRLDGELLHSEDPGFNVSKILV